MGDVLALSAFDAEPVGVEVRAEVVKGGVGVGVLDVAGVDQPGPPQGSGDLPYGLGDRLEVERWSPGRDSDRGAGRDRIRAASTHFQHRA